MCCVYVRLACSIALAFGLKCQYKRSLTIMCAAKTYLHKRGWLEYWGVGARKPSRTTLLFFGCPVAFWPTFLFSSPVHFPPLAINILLSLSRRQNILKSSASKFCPVGWWGQDSSKPSGLMNVTRKVSAPLLTGAI